jgi:hypothetical protein
VSKDPRLPLFRFRLVVAGTRPNERRSESSKCAFVPSRKRNMGADRSKFRRSFQFLSPGLIDHRARVLSCSKSGVLGK